MRLSLFAWAALLASCGGTPPGPAGAETAADLQRAFLGEPATAALVVGCWTLDWGGGIGRAIDGRATLPDSVRLRDEVVFATPERLVTPATHPSGRRGSGPDGPPWEERFRLNRWWIEDERLGLRFSDGERTEWLAVLAVDGQELVGAARYDGEAPPPGGAPDVAILGRRIECSFE